jgi:hypothetical protein
MRRECLITSRLAGPCASCRQPAWPAHVRGLLIYCEACCGCAPRAAAPGRAAAGPAHDAAPGKPSKAGPGHEALAADRGPSENMPRIGLPAGAGASAGWGKASDTILPRARDSGALEALRGPLCAATCSAKPWPSSKRPAWPLRPLQATARMPHTGRRWRCCRPGLAARGAATWPARTHCHAARPGRPAGVALAGPASQGQAQVPAALRGETFPRQNVLAETSSLTGGLND